MSTGLGKKMRSIFHEASSSLRNTWKTSSTRKLKEDGMGRGKYMIFKGNINNFIKNGALALEKSISLFHGRANPVRCFSVHELNTMNLELHPMSCQELGGKWYKGFWDGRSVLVKDGPGSNYDICQEIVVAAQMSTHKNVHKLLGCCMETSYPVCVFEWVENVTIGDLVFRDKNQDNLPLDWRERIRIAWGISHAMAYLHTAFHRPIIHRLLNINNVYLGKDNTPKLSDFRHAISVPEGEEYVEEDKMAGTWGYMPPECIESKRLAESVDVYIFGVFFLVILTGKKTVLPAREDSDEWTLLAEWVKNGLGDKCITEIIDPAISENKLTIDEELKKQLRASIELALRCTATEKDTRPTMVDVATQLKTILRAFESSLRVTADTEI